MKIESSIFNSNFEKKERFDLKQTKQSYKGIQWKTKPQLEGLQIDISRSIEKPIRINIPEKNFIEIDTENAKNSETRIN